MGYLDNSTIVVDAILTKLGRRLMAQGQALNIKYFTVSDTGIDYSLWNPDHPSGSAYYGEAIENLPNLEALPNASYFMRNNLVSFAGSRTITELPYVLLGGEGIGVSVAVSFGEMDQDKSIIPTLSGDTEESLGWQLIVPDSTLIEILGGGWTLATTSGQSMMFLNDQEIESAVIYETSQKEPATKIHRFNTTSDRSTTLTFISKSTGAYKHYRIEMKPINKNTQQTGA